MEVMEVMGTVALYTRNVYLKKKSTSLIVSATVFFCFTLYSVVPFRRKATYTSRTHAACIHKQHPTGKIVFQSHTQFLLAQMQIIFWDVLQHRSTTTSSPLLPPHTAKRRIKRDVFHTQRTLSKYLANIELADSKIGKKRSTSGATIERKGGGELNTKGVYWTYTHRAHSNA